MSAVYSFLTAEPVGASSTVHFLAMADLGHTTLDSADEYDYDESDDVLNYDPEGTPERVGSTPYLRLPHLLQPPPNLLSVLPSPCLALCCPVTLFDVFWCLTCDAAMLL